MSDSGLEKAREWLVHHGWSPKHVGIASGKFALALAKYRTEGEKAAVERCILAALEQRCERNTSWDLAIQAVVRTIREQEKDVLK